MKTGLIISDTYKNHDTGNGHPEKIDRVTAVIENFKRIDDKNLIWKKPAKFNLSLINKTHSKDYVNQVEKSFPKKGLVFLDGDTIISPGSKDATKDAVGSIISAINGVENKEFNNAFCAVSPPGHHAEKDKAMGFCIYNNVAVGANYLIEKYKYNKIAIIDFDVHHGNGTQDIFYDNEKVLYISTHQYPYYPGSGSEKEKGYFENDFKGAQIIRLEQNYRSTGNILDAASSLISENKERIGKKLWTTDSTGEPVEVINLENDEMEAFFVSEKIVNLQNVGIKLSKMAILTRASFQFKDLEDRFIRENIKYKVVGGLRFYERAEIKDALAFFRLLIKSDDNLSFERIINIPKRGLGSVFLRKLNDFAKKNNLSLLDSLRKYLETETLSKGPRDNITMFLKVLDKHKEMLKNKDHFEVAGALLDDIGYTDMLKNEKTIESEGRLENLKKLVVDIRSRSTLNEFLDEVSLLTDVSNEREGTEKISIMTLHSAKGLEFDYVFLPGWEEGIFPNQRSLDENGNKGLEEERRLAYVGITRARKKLSISFVNFRKQYNYNVYRSIPSRFLSELPKKNCELKLNQSLNEKRINKIDHIKSSEFSVGTLVKHDDFGEGKVLGINGKKLQVKFKKFEEIMSIFSDFVKKQ